MTDIFGRIRTGIGKGLNTVAVKTGQFVDETKLKGRLSNLRSERLKAVKVLGELVYENMKHGDLVPERITREVADIAKIDDAIFATEQEIAGLEIRAKAAIGKVETTSAAGACQCGANVEQGAKFCGSCGTKLTL